MIAVMRVFTHHLFETNVPMREDPKGAGKQRGVRIR